MKPRTMSIIPVLLLFWGLSGCFENNPSYSGDKGVSEQDKAQSEKLTASADSVVSAMYAAGEGTSPISGMQSYMKSAESLYREAADKDPSNSSANFGAALTGFELLLENKDLNEIVKNLESWNSSITDTNDPRYLLSRYFLFGESTFHVGDAQNNYDFTLDPANALAALVSLVQGSLSNPDLVSLLQLSIDTVVIPRLDNSITYIERVLGDKSFQLDIKGEGVDVEMDLGEAYLLSGAMHLLRGSLKVMNAYQFSVPGASILLDYQNPTAILPLVKTQDLNSGPFLKLRNNSMLPAAKSDFLTAIADARNGIAFIKSETDDQSNDIITAQAFAEADSAVQANMNDSIPIPALLQARNVAGELDALSSMLGGTFTVELGTGTEPVTVNLSAFLNNGIPDLKKVLPYHTWADLTKLPVEFSSARIDKEDFLINGNTYSTYNLEMLEIYQQISNSSSPYFRYVGTFSADGAFTVTGGVKYSATGYTVEELADNAPLLDNGAVYLDTQRRLSMTDAAWEKLKAYTLTHPEIYFDDVFEQNLNFSALNPLGVRGGDYVFRFAGTLNYTEIEGVSMVYLSDKPNSGVKVDMPVFPDPTFGGLLPGMTQQRLQAINSEPEV